MSSNMLDHFIKSDDYKVLDIIDLLKFDHNLSLLRERLLAVKKDSYAPNERIVILHNDHEYFYHDHPTGFNTHNLFTIIRQLDLPLFVFLIITNHSNYQKSIAPFVVSKHDCPEIYNPLMHDLSYRMLSRSGVFAAAPKKDIKFHALSMLGTARAHRIKLFQFYKSNNLQNQIKFTFANPSAKLSSTEYSVVINANDNSITNDLVYSYPHRINESWCSDLSRHPFLQSLDCIKPEITTDGNIGSSGFDFYNQFAVEIVTETVFAYPYVNITEKTFRPILMLTPFVMAGCAGVLKHLRSFGLRTFNAYWDESYDNIQDPQERMIAICQLIDQITSIPLIQLADMYTEMLPDLEHNKQVLLDHVNNTTVPLYQKFYQ